MKWNGWSNKETGLIKAIYRPINNTELHNIRSSLNDKYQSLDPYFKHFIDVDDIDWKELRQEFKG